MSLTPEEIQARIRIAKDMGCQSIEIDGIAYKFFDPSKTYPAQAIASVPDARAEDLIKPESVFDQISDEEVLYWSTPYYDQLQADKEAKKSKAKEEAERKSS